MPLLIKESAAYFFSQTLKLPVPTKTYTGQTVIVTGSNSGLGLEAARHLVRLDASKVILAVRRVDQGVIAAKSIHDSTGRSDVVKVWELDLASYDSILAFAARCQKELGRLDILLENAGTANHKFTRAEDNESTTTVNYVSTMLLALLLLPKLRDTANTHNKEVVLTFVGSFLYRLAKFPERHSDDMLGELANESKADMSDRYSTVKLMLLQAMRELASRATQPEKGRLTISYINPGSVQTGMSSNRGFLYSLMVRTWFRKTELGSRTLVHAAEGGESTHGQYLTDCKIGKVYGFVETDEGHQVQQKVWAQLMKKLESIHPGIEHEL